MAAKQPKLNNDLCPKSNIESEKQSTSKPEMTTDSEDRTSSPTSSPCSPRVTRHAAAVQQENKSSSKSSKTEQWHDVPDTEKVIQYLRAEMREGRNPIDVATEIGGPDLASKLHKKYIAPITPLLRTKTNEDYKNAEMKIWFYLLDFLSQPN